MRGSVIIRDTVCSSGIANERISDFGFHSKMAELLFLAYWNGNRELAIKWAVAFIREHQDLTDEMS